MSTTGWQCIRHAAVVVLAGSAIVVLPGCQSGGQSSARSGPGCAPLPSSSYNIYPYSTAAGAYEIRVSPGDLLVNAAGGTYSFTITACYGPARWSVSSPSSVSCNPRSGLLKTGQQVQVQAMDMSPAGTVELVVNPGHYVLSFSYSSS